MRFLGFLGLGVVLSFTIMFVLGIVMGILTPDAERRPDPGPEGPGPVMTILSAVVAFPYGFWIAWQLVM